MSVKRSADTDTLRRSEVMENILNGQQQSARQQEQIRFMTEENNQIKNEISMASGKQYDFAKADKLATLQAEVEGLERRYQFEKVRKNDLIKRHQLARIDLTHSRKMRGGVNVEKEQTQAVQRQVDILESRLDQALTKFNDALMYNKELREQIDIIREERRVFQRVHKKMEDDLRDTQRQMADRIERTNRDMDERDEYRHQAEQLEQAIAEQQEEFNEQLRELDAAMADIKNMREDQTSLQLELETREYEFADRLAETTQQAAAARTMGSAARSVNAAGEEGAAAGGGGAAADGYDAFGNGNIYSVEGEQHTITDIVAQVKEHMETGDLEELRKEYERLGDSNFSLYKYINDLTVTKETLGDEIRDLKTLISEEDASESQQRRVIKELEHKLADTEMKLEDVQSTVGKLREAIKVVGSATEDVHQHIGCGTISCNETNLLQALGNIEERSTQVLLAYQRRNTKLQMSAVKAAPPTYNDEESDENALSSHPHSVGAEVADEDVPLLPMIAPQYAHQTVSAQRLVRMTDLPSAALVNTDGSGNRQQDNVLAGLDVDDNQVLSHEEIRKLMEARLASKQEREERAARKKKEIKDLIGTSPRKR